MCTVISVLLLIYAISVLGWTVMVIVAAALIVLNFLLFVVSHCARIETKPLLQGDQAALLLNHERQDDSFTDKQSWRSFDDSETASLMKHSRMPSMSGMDFDDLDRANTLRSFSAA